MRTRSTTSSITMAFVVAMAIAPCLNVLAADAPEVTIRNYVRAETDLQMRTYVENMDAFGKFAHVREAYDVTSRATVRPNRDTIYSWSVFDLTAKQNADGSATIHFGGDSGQDNFLPITPGWNYIVGMYRPRQEILDGTWKFPKVQPVESK